MLFFHAAAGPLSSGARAPINTDQRPISDLPVEIGPMVGGSILVTKGLQGGERIVTAGVHMMRDGMKVRPIESMSR